MYLVIVFEVSFVICLLFLIASSSIIDSYNLQGQRDEQTQQDASKHHYYIRKKVCLAYYFRLQLNLTYCLSRKTFLGKSRAKLLLVCLFKLTVIIRLCTCTPKYGLGKRIMTRC